MKTINVKQILEISSQGITYKEANGNEASIDFEECFQNFLDSRFLRDAFDYNKEEFPDFQMTFEDYQQSMLKYRIVGGRNILGNKDGFYASDPKTGKPYIVFYSEPRITIECNNKQALHNLRFGLEKLGWRTRDMT